MNKSPFTLRYGFILCYIFVALTGLGCGGSSKAAADRLPNFVVIFCDDLGYGDVNWLGAVKNRTPHISTMAKEGV